ncbi:YlqD family protein [Pueribacillus sp. YX66]|uniref:YlqD family protein n=1 Tax=Pueribacillus sp. YX66 TaxID=3229242 RepID=UPI00358D48DD
MKVIRQALIKQVLTEKSKTELLNSFEKKKKQYEMECEQLDFEKRKALKNSHNKNNPFIKTRFTEEIERRKEKIRNVYFQIEQLALLPLGTEVIEKEIEILSEINVGDHVNNIDVPAEIVVKDGIILEIRE